MKASQRTMKGLACWSRRRSWSARAAMPWDLSIVRDWSTIRRTVETDRTYLVRTSTTEPVY